MNDKIATTNALNEAIDRLDTIHFGGDFCAASTARDAAEEIIIALYDALTAEPEPEPVRVPDETVERLCNACEVLTGEDCAGIAMDYSGDWYVYEDKPTDFGGGWLGARDYHLILRPERHNLPAPDALDWRESWHPRPGARDCVTKTVATNKAPSNEGALFFR